MTATAMRSLLAARSAAPMKGGKSSPYRLLAIYEKTATGWQLVHANVSVVTPR